MNAPPAARITWVLKASKLCNLRCRYCYEFDSLSNRERIDENSLELMFHKIRDISHLYGAYPKICWHGGEPLLLPPSFFERAFEAQKRVFASDSYLPPNVIQTNLTLITPKILTLLSHFTQVSISLDLFGGLRLHKDRRDSQDTVLANMEQLANAGIAFGAISVLTSVNAPYVRKIFEFFNRAGIGFRVLPFYRSAHAEQVEEFSLSPAEILSAYKALIDCWLESGRGILVQPVDEYLRAAMLSLTQAIPQFIYRKSLQERVYVLDTNGDLYSVADTYDVRYRHGNLFRDEIASLLSSPGRKRAINEAEQRMNESCSYCQWIGYCSGWPAAEATPLERSYDDGHFVCTVVRPAIAYAKQRLTESWPDAARALLIEGEVPAPSFEDPG